MEYTDKVLLDMQKKKRLYNRKFADWYFAFFKEIGGKIEKRYVTKPKIDKNGNVVRKIDVEKDDNGNDVFIERTVYEKDKLELFPSDNVPGTYFNKAVRMQSCCDLWVWNVYHKNKLMDLRKLNRCMNSRFCPNCKKLNVLKFIHEFRAKVPSLDDYDCFLLTLTVPSEKCDGDRLRDMIDRLYHSFRLLNHKYSSPLFTPSGKVSSRALQDRLVTFAGGVRVLEITHNAQNGYHPHLHCIVCVPKGTVESELLDKNIEGKWSQKRKSYNYKSLVDEQIGKVWTMLWYGVDGRKWSSYEYDVKRTYIQLDGQDTDMKNLEVDFTPMDNGGIYEVFKYTFKSSDVKSYTVFKVLNQALAYKRIRQGFGVLHDLRCDDDNDGDYQELVLEVQEEPEQILTREFDELLTDFRDYKKISRFHPDDKDGFVTNLAD